MDFYGIDFLRGHSGIIDYIWYLLIFSLLVILLIVLGLSLRHRLKTKYRELSLIVLLLLMFSLGIQYSNYKINQSKQSQSSQMVSFLQSLSKSQEVSIDDIYVNSTQFSDGVTVLINDKYYKVTLNIDQKTYILTETYLIDSKVNIISK
ncbi:DUF3290 domain-containing protein [Lactococcus piscium]|uniref:DUF3290 family protein n=1 Tax=Pseudolactococcus carnosus TaxID=2749961 RepID=UPI000811F85F|nr:DUF3290 family protein [Lactococcus carnosus]MCJ1975058.1 DUF3290 domain-containing protein [Lactococcus carnosus]MCJ1985474.1 DUF3290 domain-containing protein [Lactococcus carnosus]SCA90928.1 conserved hypothetical protein [Lactococcus piscium]